MTKHQLIAALADLPDDAKILIECVSVDYDECDPKTLAVIERVQIHEPPNPFAVIVHRIY